MPRKPKDANDELAKALGERLSTAMARAGLNVTELHRRTGISRTVLLAYSRGTYAPGARELRLLCEQLQVSPTVLLFGAESIGDAPYRLGDLALTTHGTRVIAFTVLLGHLTRAEQSALLTLAEGLAEARDPKAYQQATSYVRRLLQADSPMASDETMSALFQPIAADMERMAKEVEARALGPVALSPQSASKPDKK